MEKLGILEGLLFIVGDDGISLRQLSEILGISEDEVLSLIDTLTENLAQASRGLQIEKYDNNFKFTTKKEHLDYYKKLVEVEENAPLSQSALETLAIVAYNAPLTRTQVDEIRGVSSAHIIRKLLLRGLIREVGRSTLPGRPILYETTPEFLDCFGLSSLEDLPKIDNIEVIDDFETNLFDSKYKEF